MVFYLALSFGTHSSVSSFFLTLCPGFYAADEAATPPSLEGVPSVGWTVEFSNALRLGCLSSLRECPVACLSLHGLTAVQCAKICQCPKVGRSQRSLRFVLTGRQAQIIHLKIRKYLEFCRTRSISQPVSQNRRSGGIPWVKVIKIRIPEERTSSFLGDNREL